jgi:hypothetical protein
MNNNNDKNKQENAINVLPSRLEYREKVIDGLLQNVPSDFLNTGSIRFPKWVLKRSDSSYRSPILFQEGFDGPLKYMIQTLPKLNLEVAQFGLEYLGLSGWTPKRASVLPAEFNSLFTSLLAREVLFDGRFPDPKDKEAIEQLKDEIRDQYINLDPKEAHALFYALGWRYLQVANKGIFCMCSEDSDIDGIPSQVRIRVRIKKHSEEEQRYSLNSAIQLIGFKQIKASNHCLETNPEGVISIIRSEAPSIYNGEAGPQKSGFTLKCARSQKAHFT